MRYCVIYDGLCNLCVTLTQILEHLDQGQRFSYSPMQADDLLQHWGIMPAECELGMILLDTQAPERRWQGTAAAEEIGRLFPAGSWFVFAYRTLPLLKGVGDRLYGVVRDHRYFLFGQRTSVYEPLYPVCSSNACQGYFGTPHKILGG